MTVHAMAAATRGSALDPFTFETPPLGPFDCVLRVKACGICHSDVHMIDDDWSITSFPLVPGHEVVGEVLEIGSHVTHLKAGDRVGVGWQRSACLQCPDCLRGNENLCAKNEGVIVGHHGGFADVLHMDSRFCFPLPEGIDTLAAGPLLCGGITVYSALRNAGMGSGLSVGVIGVGGLGHMAVQFASKLGNRVTAFTTSPDKADLAVGMGAHEVVVLGEGDRPSAKEPLDIILNTVPRDPGLADYLPLLASDGVLTFVGIPMEPVSLPVWLLLERRRRVMASPIGGRALITAMLEDADRFGVAPVVETFPLSEVNGAIAKVRDNTVRFRAVLTL